MPHVRFTSDNGSVVTIESTQFDSTFDIIKSAFVLANFVENMLVAGQHDHLDALLRGAVSVGCETGGLFLTSRPDDIAMVDSAIAMGISERPDDVEQGEQLQTVEEAEAVLMGLEAEAMANVLIEDEKRQRVLDQIDAAITNIRAAYAKVDKMVTEVAGIDYTEDPRDPFEVLEELGVRIMALADTLSNDPAGPGIYNFGAGIKLGTAMLHDGSLLITGRR